MCHSIAAFIRLHAAQAITDGLSARDLTPKPCDLRKGTSRVRLCLYAILAQLGLS